MKNNFILITLLFFLISVASLASEIQKETFIYSIKGKDTLRLDKYELPSIKDTKPCLIFVFGGGFITGSRDNKDYIQYFEEFAKSGYSVISIDYRLGLKGLKTPETDSPLAFIPILRNTIDIAVEDLFDATSFIVENADEWNIDKQKIIASGSSAGAITVLQGEYEICNQKTLSKKLPSGFNYAGVISFAGAILSMKSDLEWDTPPAPLMLFHGNADGNVPYDKILFFNMGLYGSKYIAAQFTQKDYPHYFYDADNVDHSLANTPMTDNITEIKEFLDRLVFGKQKSIINKKAEQHDGIERKKDHDILNYIINNFGS